MKKKIKNQKKQGVWIELGAAIIRQIKWMVFWSTQATGTYENFINPEKLLEFVNPKNTRNVNPPPQKKTKTKTPVEVSNIFTASKYHVRQMAV